MSEACYIGDFRIIRPRFAVDHESSVGWLAAAHARSESTFRGGGFDEEGFRQSMERLIGRYGCGAESLAGRGHDLEDFRHRDWSRMRLFDLDANPRGAGMGARMEVFSEIADRALESFYPEAETAPPDEIIHVTCTGYAAPSAPQKLVARRGWQSRVGVVHAYHMGCYASLPALRMASAFLASPRSRESGKRVDIVHTECCTLHLDPGRHNPEQLVVQSLFADGHIRYTMGPESAGGLRFLGTHEEIIPDSQESMGWSLGDHGMSMTLSRDVPDRIAGILRGFVLRMFARVGEDPAETLGKGVFAVHPGGPRIIDKVAELLELKPEQVAASRAVLKACGNMSSATLPHVWAEIARDRRVPPGTPIASLAFGPGLTVYGALLRKA